MSTQTLQSPYVLDPDVVEQFRRDGYVHLRDVLGADELAVYEREISEKVVELNTMHLPLEERSTYDKASCRS